MSRRFSFVLISVIAFVLAACGGGAAGGGGGAASSATLDQTFSQEGLSFKYPSGWVAEGEQGQAFIANSQDTLSRAQLDQAEAPTLNAGDRVMSILSFGADMVSAMGTTSPLQLLQTMTEGSAEAIGVTLSEPVETTIGGKAAARATGTSDTLDVQYVVVNLDASGYVILFGITPKGELASLEPTLNAVAETITVEPVAAG